MIAADPKHNDGKGSLEYLVKNSSTAERFKHLVDKNGKWVVRDDVWISYLDRNDLALGDFYETRLQIIEAYELIREQRRL